MFNSMYLKWEDDWNKIEMGSTLVLIFWVFLFDIMVCEFGQWVAIRFEQFGEELEKCDWHLLPTELQRLHLIFLLNTQQEVNIQCYGGIPCTREISKKVMINGNHIFINKNLEITDYFTYFQITTKGFSYFMTLRKMK